MENLSGLVYDCWQRPEAYPRVEHLKGAYIGLYRKGLSGTKTLAYNK